MKSLSWLTLFVVSRWVDVTILEAVKYLPITFQSESGPINWPLKLWITIHGSPPFDKEDDYKVTVAGEECQDTNSYHDNPSITEIACNIFSDETRSGLIQAWHPKTGQLIAQSTKEFHLVDWEFYGIYPTFGPASGGTRVSLYLPDYPVAYLTEIAIGGLRTEGIDSQVNYHTSLNRIIHRYIP